MNVRTRIAIFLLMLVMAGCASNKPLNQPPQGVQAQAIEKQAGFSADALRFSAVVTPDSEVPLAFRIPGYVISLKQVRGQDGRMRDIAEGDRVSRGAVLVRIRSSEYEDKVRQASSQAAAAEAVVLRKQSSTLIALRTSMTLRALRNPISILLAHNTTQARNS